MTNGTIGARDSDCNAEGKKKGRVTDCNKNECLGGLLNQCDYCINKKRNERKEPKERREKTVGESLRNYD